MDRLQEPALNEHVPALHHDLVAIVQAALAAVRTDRLLERALAASSDLGASSAPLDVIAAGKGAPGMAVAFATHAPRPVRRGLVAGPQSDDDLPASFTRLVTSHPSPDEASVQAGAAALDLARSVGSGRLALLLSGGASAMLALPAPGITLADKIRTGKVLMEAGAHIGELNAVRKHISAIKGGRLAAAAGGAVTTFAVSDVFTPIEDDPAVIGSGPTVPDPTTFRTALEVVDRYGVRDRLPAAVVDRLVRGSKGDADETPKPGDPIFTQSTFQVIGGRRDAMAGAKDAADRLGFSVITIDEALTGEARDAAARVAAELPGRLAGRRRPCCIITSGETTVRVRGSGHGGRNQELALALAAPLAELGEPAAALSAGTDGVDGPTDAAGAFVDHQTLARAASLGLAPAMHYLDRNDSYRFFEALGDLFKPGPTGTNVGDIQVVLVGSRTA